MSLSEAVRARRYAQPQLTLEGRAVSPEAKALVLYVSDEIVLASLSPSQKRPTSVPAIRQATEGTLAGLLLALCLPYGDGWLRRSMSNESFTKEAVGIRQFRKVKDALQGAGLAEIIDGYADFSERSGKNADTRIRLSEAGLQLAERHGIAQQDVRLHFAGESGDEKEGP